MINLQIFFLAFFQTPSPTNIASADSSGLGGVLGPIFQGVTIVVRIGAAWKLAHSLGKIERDLANNTTQLTDLSNKVEKIRTDIFSQDGIFVKIAQIEKAVTNLGETDKRLEDDVKGLRNDRKKE